jgi:hypothetical protein
MVRVLPANEEAFNAVSDLSRQCAERTDDWIGFLVWHLALHKASVRTMLEAQATEQSARLNMSANQLGNYG